MSRAPRPPPKKSEPPKRKPWDQIIATQGDGRQLTTYAAVGNALSTWTQFELELAMLFSAFTTEAPIEDELSMAPVLAFGSVRTFEGRAEMFKFTGDYFFAVQKLRAIRSRRNPEIDTEINALQRRFVELLTKANQLVGRRNEIAHGIVRMKPQGMTDDRTFYLRPAYIEAKKHNDFTMPKFSYGSMELKQYAIQFAEIGTEAARLNKDVRAMLKERRKASPSQ